MYERGGWLAGFLGRFELRCVADDGECVGKACFHRLARALKFADSNTSEWFTERVM